MAPRLSSDSVAGVSVGAKKDMKKSAKNDDGAAGGVGAHHQGHRFSLAMSSSSPKARDDPTKIFKLIDENIIGKGSVFLGPYGRRKGE